MKTCSAVKASSALICLVSVIGCAGSGSDDDGLASTINISAIEPCIVTPGSNLRVYGDFSAPINTFFFQTGGNASIISQEANLANVRVPAGTTSGTLTASRTSPSGLGTYAYTVGSLVSIPEVEPNEAVDGSNATLAGNNRRVTGVLADAADADHFRFSCMENKSMRVTVTPAIVTEVIVNGNTILLVGGTGTFTSTTDSMVLGLVNGVGSYSVAITPA